jgi:quinol monooxygenase YgiN
MAIVLINVFTVEPVNQQRLVDSLQQAAEGLISRQPGYLSAWIHRGLDGDKVAVYAQWESREHFDAFIANPDAAAYIRETRALASAEPVVYELAFTHQP